MCKSTPTRAPKDDAEWAELKDLQRQSKKLTSQCDAAYDLAHRHISAWMRATTYFMMSALALPLAMILRTEWWNFLLVLALMGITYWHHRDWERIVEAAMGNQRELTDRLGDLVWRQCEILGTQNQLNEKLISEGLPPRT